MGLDYDSSSQYIKGGRIKGNTMCSQGWSPNDLSQNHWRNCPTPDLLTQEIMTHVYNELPRWRLYTQKPVPRFPMEHRKRDWKHRRKRLILLCEIWKDFWRRQYLTVVFKGLHKLVERHGRHKKFLMQGAQEGCYQVITLGGFMYTRNGMFCGNRSC